MIYLSFMTREKKYLFLFVRHVHEAQKKEGKLIISRRYNQTPLLYSYPGGFNGS